MNNNLKAVSRTDDELRVANYMILFGGRDVTGEYFTAETEYDSPYTKSGMIHVDFEHGLDPDNLGMGSDEVLGHIDWSTARVDQKGVFVERVLSRQGRYMSQIEELIDAGVMGTSSEAVAGKTARTDDGQITSWPIKRDSLTLTPAEPRMVGGNVLQAAKSLRDAMPHSVSLSETIAKADFKTALQDAPDLKSIERLLRDAAGLSRTETQALVSRVKSLHQSDSDRKTEPAAIARLQRFSEDIEKLDTGGSR